FFCVDNLPVSLLAKFHELIVKSQDEGSKAAMVIDVREGQTLAEFPAAYQDLKKNATLEMSLWFLEASDNVLVCRFSETRRPHPLDPDRPVVDAIVRAVQPRAQWLPPPAATGRGAAAGAFCSTGAPGRHLNTHRAA